MVNMKTILIVDDHLDLRELVEVTLRVNDYRILHAESGNQAIEITRKESPDLIHHGRDDARRPGWIRSHQDHKK